MGLPNIFINFEGTGATAITRSARGVVCLILEETTASVNTYTSLTDVESADYTADNYKYIKLSFLSAPNKVIVISVATGESTTVEGLTEASKYSFDYLAVPTADATDVTAITSWLATQRGLDKIYKAVLPNAVADKEYIINFTTSDIETADKTYTTAEYCCRIAGILAGLSLDRSATYYKLSDVISIAESATPDDDIDAGKLILINDGENIKIGRAINSFTTTTATKTVAFKKIKIVEGMDLIKRDIKKTFEDNYIGNYVNNYDNQVILITAINAYLGTLEGTVLDNNFDNVVSVDVSAQKSAWESAGVDVSELNELEVKLKTYLSNVYLTANLKFLDAIEDLQININL